MTWDTEDTVAKETLLGTVLGLARGTLIFPTWTSLKRLGANPAMKATALMPVLGYLILIKDQVRFSDAFWIRFSGGEPVDVGWVWLIGAPLMTCEPYRLYLIYFGLTALGLGALLFAWRCPHEIRDYPDRIAFVQSRLEHTTEMRRTDFLTYAMGHCDRVRWWQWANNRAKLKTVLEEQCVHMVSFYRTHESVSSTYQGAKHWFLEETREQDRATAETHRKRITDTFTNVCSRLHQLRNVEALPVRFLIRILWTAGFTLLAIPSLYAFLAVLTVVLWGAVAN
ncbi:MAG: hypothetical protein AAGH68_01330 [Pseudomonadota bacterium]